MMTESANQNELNRNVAIFGNVSQILELITPETLRLLGGIATVAAEGPEQKYVYEVADTVEAVQIKLEEISDAINEISVRPIVTEEVSVQNADEPSNLHEPVNEVAQEAHPEPYEQILEPKQASTANEDHFEPEDTNELIRSSVEKLGLSPNEIAIVKHAVSYLKDFQDRKPLRDITQFVFERSKLPRKEELRLIYILDGLAAEGLLRGYGKSYGYKTSLERDANTAQSDRFDIDSSGAKVTEEDKDILQFVAECTNTNGAELNIGQIVRGYFKVKTLEPDKFKEFVSKLNALSTQGHFIHAEGSPWYTYTGTVSESDTKTTSIDASQLPHIQTTPSLKPIDAENTQPDTSSLSEDKTTTAGESPLNETSVNLEESKIMTLTGDLTERERLLTFAVLKSIPVGQEFQRKSIDLSHVEFADDSERDKAFASLTRLFPKLVQLGILRDNGKARGGKAYRIIIDFSPTKSPPVVTDELVKKGVAIAKPPAQPPKSKPAHRQPAINRAIKTDSPSELTAPEAPRRVVIAEKRRAAQFAARIVTEISAQLEMAEDGKEKVSDVSKSLAKQLGIKPPEAREIISELVNNGHFYLNGHRKGSRLLALTKPQDTGKSTKLTSDETRKAKENAQQWTDKDVVSVALIFDSLLQLTHVQQGLVIPKLISGLEISADTEDSFRRALRKAEAKGYIVVKNINSNTRSPRSKKLNQPAVLFPDQKAKERWKNNREEVMAELLAFVE